LICAATSPSSRPPDPRLLHPPSPAIITPTGRKCTRPSPVVCSPMTDKDALGRLNRLPTGGALRLYWMQHPGGVRQPPRSTAGGARPTGWELPVLAVFGLDVLPRGEPPLLRLPPRGPRVRGATLERRGVQLAGDPASPDERPCRMSLRRRRLVVCDPRRPAHQRAWRGRVRPRPPARGAGSTGRGGAARRRLRKAEWAAATLRPRSSAAATRYLAAGAADGPPPRRDSLGIDVRGTSATSATVSWTACRSTGRCHRCPHEGRDDEALARLARFVGAPSWGNRRRTATRPPTRTPASPRTCTSARSPRCGSRSPRAAPALPAGPRRRSSSSSSCGGSSRPTSRSTTTGATGSRAFPTGRARRSPPTP